MEDGQLCRRVERGAARLVNQNVVFRNRSDDGRVDEVVDQALGRRVADVRRVDADGVAVLGELCFLVRVRDSRLCDAGHLADVVHQPRETVAPAGPIDAGRGDSLDGSATK